MQLPFSHPCRERASNAWQAHLHHPAHSNPRQCYAYVALAQILDPDSGAGTGTRPPLSGKFPTFTLMHLVWYPDLPLNTANTPTW